MNNRLLIIKETDYLKSTIIVRFVQKVMNLLQKLCFDGCSGSTLEGMNVGSL